jgi:hypothetical protein
LPVHRLLCRLQLGAQLQPQALVQQLALGHTPRQHLRMGRLAVAKGTGRLVYRGTAHTSDFKPVLCFRV